MNEIEEFKNGAISVRVSTNMQVKYSPDSQIKLCLEYAKSHNIFSYHILPYMRQNH